MSSSRERGRGCIRDTGDGPEMRFGQRARARLIYVAVSLVAWVPQLAVMACAPDFPVTVISNQTHPDLSLKLFAAGNLGVVQPSWARSYLCVAYRYLSGLPLDPGEQTSIIRLWHSRLARELQMSGDCFDNVSEYLKVRTRALGASDRKVPDLYSKLDSYAYQQNIGISAIALATKTLADRIKKYGARSAAVREWVKGQDVVFGLTASPKPAIPPLLEHSFDPLIRADRRYQ